METYFGKPEENNLSDDINEALAAELLKFLAGFHPVWYIIVMNCGGRLRTTP